MSRIPFRPPWGRRPRPDRQQGDDARAVRAWPRAEACYVRHLETEPADQPIWVQLGHARKEQGKLHEAAEAYARAVRIDPDDPDAREHLDALRARLAAQNRRRPRLASLGRLRSGERLPAGEALTSRNGAYRLVLTLTGELRLERLHGAHEPLWSSGSKGRTSRLEIDAEDRPRVVDVLGEPIWSAERSGPKGCWLELTDQGALHLTDGRAEVRLTPAIDPPSSTEPESILFDVDTPGALSIVVQGPLFRSNVLDTAQRLEHWRTLFPSAQIIYAVSCTDLLRGARPGRLATLTPTRKHHDDGQCRAALGAVARSCDVVVLADDALPLPPFKNDSGPNNFNLQLAAATAGLDEAHGRWCLRVRSDAVFSTRDFLRDYAADAVRPRGATARFAERVLISPIFSLNPYTVERMPLHFSDWFHFGRLEDVKLLWNAAPVTLADATYYQTRPHAPGSNARERQFVSRLAVEQHLAYGCFRPLVDGLELRFHNDVSCVDLAMRIWADNFAMCDLRRSHFVFDKYLSDQMETRTALQCLTRDDWCLLIERPNVRVAELLADKSALVGRFNEEFGLVPL